jgi:adenylate kinase
VRIALTGTPGTGKSEVGRALSKRGFAVVALSRAAVRLGAVRGRDVRRASLDVDVAFLDRALSKETRAASAAGPLILEGHLAHFLTVERAVVLRCPPAVLARRLRRRGWVERKVRENACAEAVGVIVTEAVERLGRSRVFELNTAGLGPEAGARVVARVAEGGGRRHAAGAIDFLEEAPRWC